MDRIDTQYNNYMMRCLINGQKATKSFVYRMLKSWYRKMEVKRNEGNKNKDLIVNGIFFTSQNKWV